VASGSAAIATAEAVISSDRMIHRPSAAGVGGMAERERRDRPGRAQRNAVEQRIAHVLERRGDRGRGGASKAGESDGAADRGDQRAPARKLPQRHARREQHRDERGADQIGGEHEHRKLAAGMELRGTNRPPIDGVGGIVETKKGTRIDARPGKLGMVWLVTRTGDSRREVSERLDLRRKLFGSEISRDGVRTHLVLIGKRRNPGR
jgi:hypothetical protein